MRIRTPIEQLVFGGQGLGRSQGRVVFAWNALPGEEVTIRVTRKNRKFFEGIAEEVHVASPDRVDPPEPHFLSCSPWQILPFGKEMEWKRQIAMETYSHIGGYTLEQLEIVSDGVEFGYRNKMEFSFAHDESGVVQLAFFERGQHRTRAIDSCALAHPAINETAGQIVRWIREQQIPLRSLKCLIIRSNQKGETIAGLFIKDRVSLANFPQRHDRWLGFQVFLSNYRSPAAVIDETLYTDGHTWIAEDVNGVTLRYGLSSFFQVNVPLFVKALNDIKPFIEDRSFVVDFYAGVGAISIALHDRIANAELVDNNVEGIDFAQQNIALNQLNGYTARAIPAEQMTELITQEKTILLDPPRAGLHEDVTRALLEQKPKRIIYLSCNISTQARDLQRLSKIYHVAFSRLYNFFPRTPHIEGLCVFDRIAQ